MHIYIHIYVHGYVHRYIYVYMDMCLYTNICIDIQTYIYMYKPNEIKQDKGNLLVDGGYVNNLAWYIFVYYEKKTESNRK